MSTNTLRMQTLEYILIESKVFIEMADETSF